MKEKKTKSSSDPLASLALKEPVITAEGWKRRSMAKIKTKEKPKGKK